MHAVERAFLTDHFRFHPNAKFQTTAVYFKNQLMQGAAEFISIGKPVAQRTEIIPPVCKPTVINHQHVDSERLCVVSQSKDTGAGKIKVRSFPTVEQNGAWHVTVSATTEMPADTAVKPMTER